MDVFYLGDFLETKTGIAFHDELVDQGVISGNVLTCIDEVNAETLCIIFIDGKLHITDKTKRDIKERTKRIFQVFTNLGGEILDDFKDIGLLGDDLYATVDLLSLQLLAQQEIPVQIKGIYFSPNEECIIRALSFFKTTYVEKDFLGNILSCSPATLSVHISSIRRKIEPLALRIITLRDGYRLVKVECVVDEETMRNSLGSSNFVRVFDKDGGVDAKAKSRYRARRILDGVGILLLKEKGGEFQGIRVTNI